MIRDNLARIRREPSLLAIEVAWRWVFGVVAIAMLVFAFAQLKNEVRVSPEERAQLTSTDPNLLMLTLGSIGERVLPLLWRLVEFIAPVLLVLWTVASTLGRSVVLRKLIGSERARFCWTGLLGVHALRAASVVALATAYVGASLLGASISNSSFVMVGIFLAMFFVAIAVWIWVHWVLSLAANYPVSSGMGTIESVQAALRLSRTRGRELRAVAVSNGVARTVAGLCAAILGLIPLPLYRVVPGTLLAIELVLAIVYCLVSDWLLLARLVGYAEIAASEGDASSITVSR